MATFLLMLHHFPLSNQITYNFPKKASFYELADKIRSTSWGHMGQRSLHTSGTGSKFIGLPEVTLLTRVACRPLRLRAHAQYAKCILPQTFGTGLLWARYTGFSRLRVRPSNRYAIAPHIYVYGVGDCPTSGQTFPQPAYGSGQGEILRNRLTTY